MMMTGVLFFGLLVLFLQSLPTCLASYDDDAGQMRDVWIVQVLSSSDYETAIGLSNSRIAGDLPVRSGLQTELYIGPNMYGEEAMGLSLNVEKSGANGLEVGPTLRSFETMDEMRPFITSGAYGNDVRVATVLGAAGFKDDFLYNIEQTREGFMIKGVLPELWLEHVFSAENRDPFLSDFMLKLFSFLHAKARVSFPGVAGTLHDAYQATLLRYPPTALELERVQFSTDLKYIYGPSSSLTTIKFDTELSDEYYSRLQLTAGSYRWSQMAGGVWSVGPVDGSIPVAEFSPEEGPYARILRSTGYTDLELDTLSSGSGWISILESDASLASRSTSSAVTRVAGKLRSFVSVGGLVAAAVLLPTFIILDLIAGDWQAAMWTVGGAIAGTAATAGVVAALGTATIGGFAIAGPIGVLIGAAIMAIMTILPGLFKKEHKPQSNNATQIIQWVFFGNALHTGNEKCNDNLKKNHQTPNCTVVYGLEALATMFNWNQSSAAFFLIAMNEGHAMSIPDMAANFTFYDYTNPNSSASALAIIDCGKSVTCPAPKGSGVKGPITCPVSHPYTCDKPKFRLNMDLVNLPVLNVSATSIHKEINAGTCKIVSNPIEGEILYFPEASGNYTDSEPDDNMLDMVRYFLNMTSSNGTNTSDSTVGIRNSTAAMFGDLPSIRNMTTLPNATISSNVTAQFKTIHSNNSAQTASNSSFTRLVGPWKYIKGAPMNFTGKPVSIACNLTMDIPDILDPDYNTTRLSITTSANRSTAGDPSYYVAPPPAVPFEAYTAKNSACLFSSISPQLSFCLPNGTYSTCSGVFGCRTDNVDSITYPNETGFLTLPIAQQLAQEGLPKTKFQKNISKDKNFQYCMAFATATGDTFTVQYDHAAQLTPPGLCVYSAPNMKGDVFCMGQGGTNFTTNIANKIASFTLSPGLAGWFYPEYYGNPLGAYIDTSVADLSNMPYNNSQSLKSNIAAAWIYTAGDRPSHS